MEHARAQRVLAQHVLTDQLLGIASVPLGQVRHAQQPMMGLPRSPEQVLPGTGTADSSVIQKVDMSQSLSLAKKQQLLQVLDESQVKVCTRCTLCSGRLQTVFGQGDANAHLLFIGEGPGQREDEQGLPFVGRSGELLNKQIGAMGLTRSQVYIANVVKCRPPNNRAPSATEVEACRDYLCQQIAIIKPRVIVTLGGPAAKLILNRPEGITRLRGNWFTAANFFGDHPAYSQLVDTLVMPTFHPAYLLRAYTPENRKRVWSDLQQVMAKLGLTT